MVVSLIVVYIGIILIMKSTNVDNDMKLSVLMSIYIKDDFNFLKDAFDSLLYQTTQPYEVIVVCDGDLYSEHFNIVDEYIELFKDKRVSCSLVKLPVNVGLGLALASAVSSCNGDYILRMDSDDLCRPNRIEDLLNFIRNNHGFDVYGSQIEEFNILPNDLGRIRSVPLNHDDIHKFCKLRNPMNHVTVCIKKSSLLEVNSYESVLYHEDYYLWVKFLTHGFKLINASTVSVDVRVGNDLVGRRKGYSYFRHELNFALKCKEIGFFSYYDLSRYILLRFFIRMLPKRGLSFVYSKLRSKR